MLWEKVTMATEKTNVHHAQSTAYRDKQKYKHMFSVAQSYMTTQQDMRLRNKLQNYCICKKGKQWEGHGNTWKPNGIRCIYEKSLYHHEPNKWRKINFGR